MLKRLPPTRSPFALIGLVALLATLVPTTPAAAETDPVYTFDGAGWGHGVGMSQYGARAMALNGWTAEQIVTAYYNGVSIQPLSDVFDQTHWLRADEAEPPPEEDPEDPPLWIGLSQNRSSVTFHVHGPSAVGLCKANDAEGECPTQFAGQGETWEFRNLGAAQCRFYRNGSPVGNTGTCRGEIRWTDQPGTQVHLEGIGEYSRGIVKFRPVSTGTFHVSLQIGIDEYIYGLGEMPSDWHPEALQAQALAGRTYGIRQALKYGPEPQFSAGRKSQCWCHLWDTTVDQSYVGWYKENEPHDQAWVAAVDATAGQIITHPQAPDSTVIIAYYSSSSGGHTDSNMDRFGSVEYLPYLLGVPDPWSLDPIAANPYASWAKQVTASSIAAAVGLDAVTGMSVTSRFVSGTVEEVTIAGTLNGSEVEVTRSGKAIKSYFGLRSIMYDIVPPEGAVTPGTVQLCEYPAPPDAGFVDVDGSNVHKEDIDCVAMLGVIPGSTDSTFAPTELIPRSDMALFMIKAAEVLGVSLPEPADHGFEDIGHLSQAEQDAINQMAILGLTKGTGPGEYSPARTVDRWQMAIFLVRLHTAAGYEPPTPVDVFTDLDGMIDEAVRSIHQLFQMEVTVGCAVDPARYCPANQVSRQEMASFLARLIRLDT